MAKIYTRKVWKNEPSTETPINAEGLNHIEEGIDALDSKVDAQETAIQSKADKSDIDAKVFVAEYNVTTAQEIIDYLDKGVFSPIVVKRGNDYYTSIITQKVNDTRVSIRTLGTLSGNYYVFTYTITNGTWASASHGLQNMLVSGTNIKTINTQSILGDGDISV